MDDHDPISFFFPGQETVDLYDVLGLSSNATVDAIKKAYRKQALACHPDKLAAASDERKADAATKFQQVGFAYAVLSDGKRRQRYDNTGKTDEGFELGPGEDGWEAYFEQLFDLVTRERLDELKKGYQGSEEEIQDLKSAYLDSQGSIAEIMNTIPHSNFEDEPRFIVAISKLVASGDLPKMAIWENDIKDEKAKLVRKKKGEKEAEEAERMARELGVWDEFYGSGKATQRKDKGKGNKADAGVGEEDLSALQALILKNKAKSDDFFDSLAAKYAEPEPKSRKGKKRASPDSGSDDPPAKKRRGAPPPPEIDDAEFEKLQQKLFGDKAQAPSTSKAKKGRKVK
ncbi:Galactose oxidase [Mycena chlorophos]|uniref:Galactose oxidase n=1 Tax=Mycena chlorophos TaxID=658473 RepID=A0A8H6TPV4_MYCCL|nr:Galactose oxidase [Mycena chlorophos]